MEDKIYKENHKLLVKDSENNHLGKSDLKRKIEYYLKENPKLPLSFYLLSEINNGYESIVMIPSGVLNQI